MQENRTLQDLRTRTEQAVAHYWRTRSTQRKRQQQSGKLDQGLRGAVTGGAQMDGFIALFTDLISDAGIARECLYSKKRLEVPGFFRPEKQQNLMFKGDETYMARKILKCVV